MKVKNVKRVMLSVSFTTIGIVGGLKVTAADFDPNIVLGEQIGKERMFMIKIETM